jgi:hypothetical protein
MCPSVSNPNDAEAWQFMSAIKSSILRRMDTATPGVRICCIKFLQQVVLVQTPGIVDPRVCITTHPRRRHAYNLQRPDGGDISLALVSRDHPVIPYASLEAEGHGLLDRLLDIIHGDHRSDDPTNGMSALLTGYSDGLVVTATLNSLGILMQRRPIAANKILNSVLNFNALKLANSPMTPKNKVILKSIERTTRALLVNIMKKYVHLSSTCTHNWLNGYLGTPKTRSMRGYNSTWSACTELVLRCSMSLIANDQHLQSRLMALTNPRGSEWLQGRRSRRTLFHLCPLVMSAGANYTP